MKGITKPKQHSRNQCFSVIDAMKQQGVINVSPQCHTGDAGGGAATATCFSRLQYVIVNQQAQIRSFQARNQQLEARNQQLEAHIQQLEANAAQFTPSKVANLLQPAQNQDLKPGSDVAMFNLHAIAAQFTPSEVATLMGPLANIEEEEDEVQLITPTERAT